MRLFCRAERLGQIERRKQGRTTIRAMVVVKTEPHGEALYSNTDANKEQLVFTPKNEHLSNRNSINNISNSRPANSIKSKMIQNSSEKRNKHKNKVNFSDYILSPSNLYKDDLNDDSAIKFGMNKNVNIGTENKTDKVAEDSRSSPIIKSEPVERGTLTMAEINKKINNVIEPEHTINKNRKRNKIDNVNMKANLKKTKIPQMSNKLSKEREVITEPEDDVIPINPGNFTPIKQLLFDRKETGYEEREKLYAELFEDADSNDELEYCKEVVQYPLNKWLQAGQEFTLEHQQLMKEVIQARLELSYKFEVIAKTMNDRCQALIHQEDHLDNKLKQIKDIAKNMLDIL